jgi:hypothetical protein
MNVSAPYLRKNEMSAPYLDLSLYLFDYEISQATLSSSVTKKCFEK